VESFLNSGGNKQKIQVKMQSTAQKLKIKEPTRIVLLNPPEGIENTLEPLPKGSVVSTKPAKSNNFIMIFVKNKTELEKTIFKAVKLLNKEGLIWICYPKGSSGIQTDLTRDKGWESLSKVNMQWLSLISLDETWSAFCMKNVPSNNNVTKASKDYHATVKEWAHAASKTVKIPADLKKAMEAGKVKKIFDELNFTGRKEYVIWIVSAKQEKTREERIAKAIQKLKAGKKTPQEK